MKKVWLNVFHQIDLKDTTVKIKDGGSNSIEVKIGEGNLSWTERRNMQYTLDRGLLDEVREGDQVPVEVSLDFLWEYITGTTGTGGLPTVEDALKRINAAAAWVSSDSDACRPFAVDIEIANVPSPSGCGDSETITLSDFRYEELGHDLRAGSISVSGKCNITQATVVRT
jgi:hypothetical protein